MGVSLPESPSGYRSGRSTINVIFTLRQIIEKCKEQRQNLHITFIDFTKAFDCGNQELLFKILEKLGWPVNFVCVMKSLYSGVYVRLCIERRTFWTHYVQHWRQAEMQNSSYVVRDICSNDPILYYTILYYTILYYTILYYTILYYTILYYTILYYTLLCCTILYYTILYHTIPYYTILYYTILYYTILYYTILYYTILYYTILYYTILYYISICQSSK